MWEHGLVIVGDLNIIFLVESAASLCDVSEWGPWSSCKTGQGAHDVTTRRSYKISDLMKQENNGKKTFNNYMCILLVNPLKPYISLYTQDYCVTVE